MRALLVLRAVTAHAVWCAAGGALGAALLPGAAAAQATDAAITGVVRGSDGAPLAGATVSLRNEATGYTSRRTTNERGQYAFFQLPLGGPYTVSAQRIGRQEGRRANVELHLGDRVPVDFQLRPTAVTLQGVTVVSEPVNARTERVGGSTAISAREIATIPTTGRNFTDLAILSPLAGSTTGTNVSLGGDKEVSTGIEVDGLSARNAIQGGVPGGAPYVLSLEAIREFEIATNVYDVTRGRQGGGSLSAATKSGTNHFRGSLFTYHRNDGLAGADYTRRRPSDFGLYQWGGSLGGPIVRDRAHFFVALDRQDESQPYRVLDIRTDDDANAEGIHRDTLARVLDVLQSKYGLSAGSQVGSFTRRPVSTTGFARVDWQLGDRHRLAARANVVDWFGEAVDGNDETLREAYADRRALTYATLGSLTSSLSATVQNELKFGFTASRTSYDGLTALPKGVVTVASVLPNGNRTNKNITFGGNSSGFNEGTEQNNFQLVNTTQVDRGSARFKFGVDQLFSNIWVKQYLSRWGGQFTFRSLADLEAMRPSQYQRKVPVPFSEEPFAKVNVWDGAAFAQAEWEPSRRLRAMVGLRYDVTSFLTGAQHNPDVERLLGLRTDNNPTDWDNVQPRAQLTWDVRGDGRQVLRVGGGMYSAQTLYLNQANNVLNPGNRAYTATLTGAAVPRPDFPGYRDDPSLIPVPDPVTGAPEVNLISDGFEMPTAWKGNVAFQQLLGDWLSLGVNLLFSRTSDNYHYFDRNLVDDPYFTIEGGRGVFVPAARIDARGVLNATRDAVKTSQLGRVRELVGAGEARQRAMVLEAGLRLPRASTLNFSYTLNESRDNSTYNCCAPGTSMNTAVADDPRDLNAAWGYSDFDFRHKLVGYGSLPTLLGFRLSGRYVARSGTPVSLVVGSDINGDGTSQNDLAFVFDPDDPATPAAVAASMRRVLDNPRSLLRDYVRANVGRIAERNGGRAPWRHNLDVRLSREVRVRGQRTELLLDVFNFANLLNTKSGGFYHIANKQSLLTVTGFDQATRRYVYTVNENLGVVNQKSGAGYQIQLGARHAF